MNRPTTDAQLKQARRNQEFTQSPVGVSQCGLGAQEVAIFPVRYALDESPTTKGNPQGPHPLPAGWSSELPALETRSYTLRQLRDGWVYVWDSVDQTFHEYQAQGERFTRHTWTEAQLNQDIRHNPGDSRPYLLYPRRSQLHIAYSPVQWTWRLCEWMRSNTAQNPWMRTVDLPTYCRTGSAPHVARLRTLGESVADIQVYGQPAPRFSSTLLPTQPNPGETGKPFKPAFEESLVRGRVPDQGSALFVALDDPLALIDDLNMNLGGRLLELAQFKNQHQHLLESAGTVQRLCGLDVDAFIPASITDPLQKQAYIDDLYTLIAAYDDVEHASELVPHFDREIGMTIVARAPIEAAQREFTAKWGHLPDREKWQQAVESWHDRRLWRDDVRFDDIRHYLGTTIRQAIQLEQHCQRSEDDLLTWLDRLGTRAEELFHDTCDAAQASQLLHMAHTTYTFLGNGEKGREWLCQQAACPSKLFGLALYNFNAELETVIRQVTLNYSRTGSLDDQGREGDGSTPALSPTSGDITNLGTRFNEIKGLFNLDAVKNSALYQTMSGSAKEAMSTLSRVANHESQAAWHGLSFLMTPAMRGEAALPLVSPLVLFSHEISTGTQLTTRSTYPQDFQAWLRKVILLQKRITATQNVLRRPGHLYDHRSAHIALHGLETQLKELMVLRPNLIIARASGATRLNVDLPTLNVWLADLGRDEVLYQLKTAGTYDYLNHAKAWVNQNLGNALPALLVGLNAWNLHNSAVQAFNDGRFTADEWRIVGANAAYAANAFAALWVGPAWHRAGGMSAVLGKETLKVAEAGYVEWLGAAKTAPNGSVKAALASDFASVSKGLILRTVTWAALGTIAAGLEAWQISKDIDRATSEEETDALTKKQYSVVGMGMVAAGQLVGVVLGYWFPFAWVMSTPVTIVIALLGIAYLLMTMAANRYKREGLRLWLYRCNWGRGATATWLEGQKGHLEQMDALTEILQRPSVVGKALSVGGARPSIQWQGFWLHIQIPSVLVGKALTLQPAMIERRDSSGYQLKATTDHFYEQFLDGNWVAPDQLGQLPNKPGDKTERVNFNYSDEDQHLVWQVWIASSTPRPVIELEVKYPPGVLQRGDGRGYLFRVALSGGASEADRLNDAFSGELKDDDEIVLHKERTRLLTLTVPTPNKA